MSSLLLIQPGPRKDQVTVERREADGDTLAVRVTASFASEKHFRDAAKKLAVSQANLMATDYRFSPKIPRPNMGEVGAIQYRLRDNKWLNRSNKMVNASGVSLKVETETANLAAKPSGRRLGIIALIVIFSAGVVFFIVKKRRHL